MNLSEIRFAYITSLTLFVVFNFYSKAQQEVQIDSIIDNRIDKLGIKEVIKTVTYGESVSQLTKRYNSAGNLIEIMVDQPYHKRRGTNKYDSLGRIIGSSYFRSLEEEKPYSTEITLYNDSTNWTKRKFNRSGELTKIVNSKYEKTPVGFNVVDSITNYSEYTLNSSTRVSKFCVQYYGDTINLSESTDFQSNQIFVNYMVRKVTPDKKRIIIHGKSIITKEELDCLISGLALDSIVSLANDSNFQKHIADNIEEVPLTEGDRRDIFDLEGHLLKQEYETYFLEFKYDESWKLLFTNSSKRNGLALSEVDYTYLDNGLPQIVTVVSFEKGVTTTYNYQYQFE